MDARFVVLPFNPPTRLCKLAMYRTALGQRLENELAKIDIRREYLHALKSERVVALDMFEDIYKDMWFSRILINREGNGGLDVFEWMLARADAKLPENAANPSSDISDTPPSTTIFGQLLLPALQAGETAADRVEAEIRVLRVLNALGRRADPQKAPLPDLSDLGLPATATTDPFSGKPLIVKKVEGGWLVYSVGENKIDDGGKLEQDDDTGENPRHRPSPHDSHQSETVGWAERSEPHQTKLLPTIFYRHIKTLG